MLKQTEQQFIEDLLESDDELPLDYVEEPELPAYQNDSRFDKIHFNWIDSNFSKYYCTQKSREQICLSNLYYDSLNEDNIQKKTAGLKVGEKAMILKSVLNRQDIYCLQAVEPITSDATLLWFINFLIYKDLQSNFSFLKACLVNKLFENHRDLDTDKNLSCSESKKYSFDIVITK